MRQGCVGTERARNNTRYGAFAFNLGSQYETQQERKALTTDLQSNPVELQPAATAPDLLFSSSSTNFCKISLIKIFLLLEVQEATTHFP